VKLSKNPDISDVEEGIDRVSVPSAGEALEKPI
jgi:hypothetical protein